jgi:hypothetical protein
LCSDETVQIDQIDSFDDLPGLTSTFDPLEGQGNMLNAQSKLTDLPETQTTKELPKTTEKKLVEDIIAVVNRVSLNTEGGEDSLNSEGNVIDAEIELAKLLTTETPSGPSKFTAMSTKASTITTKNPSTTTMKNVATGAMLTLDNRNPLNTDEEDSSLHEDPESQASAEENAEWWIWPLFCVSVGTILRKHIFLF